MVEETKDANSQILESYGPKLNDHIQFTKNIIRFSPAGALTFLVTDVAGSGAYEEVRLKDYLTGFLQRNFDVIAQIQKGVIEDFRYNRAGLGEVVAQSAFVDLVSVMISGILFLALSIVVFLRYDPR